MRCISLKQGFHIIPRDKDGPLLASEVGGFFDELRAEADAPLRYGGALLISVISTALSMLSGDHPVRVAMIRGPRDEP